jgi:hypothetical protein
MQKFLMEELYNCKILTRLDENAQLILSNIEEDLYEKLLPVVERTLIIMSELRGIVRSKHVQLGLQ